MTRHLLSVADLGTEGIREVLRLTDTFVEVSSRAIPRVPALRGKTVVLSFFEDSTRTRMSFETAARRLSADVLSFSAASSSLNKGESIRDTVETIEAIGADAIVLRHGGSGVPWQVARWLNGPAVINAGDGSHEHPTQALLDCYTIERHFSTSLAGLQIGIVGDIRHSRVARSGMIAFAALGAKVTLLAPPTLLPASLAGWPATVCHDLDAALGDLDVVYALRLQRERTKEALLPSLREYTATFGITAERAARMKPSAVVMHPGPVNRGVEVASEVAGGPRSLMTRQVSNGVAVRMAVLYLLVSTGADLVAA